LLLDSYNAKRHPVGAEVIAQAGRMTKLALVTNPVLQKVREHLLGPDAGSLPGPGGIELVRPDGYLAMSAREGKCGAVAAYLGRLT
jgi:hypothetical protein